MNIEQRNNLTMKELPKNERPYEKLEKEGAAALSDAQLLAVLLQNGSQGENVMDMALRLLSTQARGGKDPLLQLFDLSFRELKAIRGIGRVKAIKIKTVGELAKRLSHKQASLHLLMDTPSKIFDLYKDEMRLLTEETARVVYLNAKMEMVGELYLGSGTLTMTLVNTRDIFVKGYEIGAYAFVLIHNHPSGDPAPSPQDKALTRKIRSMASVMELPMVDHIIVGDQRFYSFEETRDYS